MQLTISRRSALRSLAAMTALPALQRIGRSAEADTFPPVRAITANADGSDLYVLDPSGNTSHFIWRDAEHVCMWTQPEGRSAGFCVFRDRTPEIEPVGAGVLTRNGHVTYVPRTDNEWILNDTYTQGDAREQKPYLYHIPSGRKVGLGRFHSPPAYTGEWRCDTHPRCSNDGETVAIDSPHSGVECGGKSARHRLGSPRIGPARDGARASVRAPSQGGVAVPQTGLCHRTPHRNAASSVSA